MSSSKSEEALIPSSMLTFSSTILMSLSIIPFIERFNTYLLSKISLENNFQSWGILHSWLSLKVKINFCYEEELMKSSKALLKSDMYANHFIEEVLKTSGMLFITLTDGVC